MNVHFENTNHSKTLVEYMKSTVYRTSLPLIKLTLHLQDIHCNIVITGKDDRSVSVNALVLASFSPLVAGILRNQCSNQIIFPDVDVENIVAIMEVMHTGK